MRERADFSVEESETGGTRVVLSGALLVSTIGQLDRKLRHWEGPADVVDLSASGAIDTVGAWCVWRFARDTGASITGASREAKLLIEAVKSSESTAEITPPVLPVPERVAEAVGLFMTGRSSSPLPD